MQGSYYGVEVNWLRGGVEMFRYPSEEKAREAQHYLSRHHPDVKFAAFVGFKENVLDD